MAHDLIHRMQSLFPAATDPWRPAADVYRTADGWLVKFDLAGVQRHDITLARQGPRLTIRGCRRDTCLGETCGQLHLEISYSSFERSIVLPEDIAALRLDTDYRDGMLLVRLRKEKAR